MGDKFAEDEENVAEHLPRASSIEWRLTSAGREHKPFAPKAENQPVGTTIEVGKKRFCEVKNAAD